MLLAWKVELEKFAGALRPEEIRSAVLLGLLSVVIYPLLPDQFVVDMGDDDASVGDRAILFGDPATGVPSAEDWAAASDTINYEIVTRIGPRVTRVFVP